MKPIKGHGLRGEGRVLSTGGWVKSGPDVGRCECGASSDHLPNTAARKRWHREHKQAVLDQRGPAANCLACKPPRGFPTFEDAQRHARNWIGAVMWRLHLPGLKGWWDAGTDAGVSRRFRRRQQRKTGIRP